MLIPRFELISFSHETTRGGNNDLGGVDFTWLFAWVSSTRNSSLRHQKRTLEQQKALEKQALEREIERRAREGLRGRIFDDKEVPAAAWRPEWNLPGRNVKWLEGEHRGLLPEDIVWEWDFTPHPMAGRHGFAIERNGRIVAEVTAWIS